MTFKRSVFYSECRPFLFIFAYQLYKYHNYEKGTTIVHLFNAFSGCFCC